MDADSTATATEPPAPGERRWIPYVVAVACVFAAISARSTMEHVRAYKHAVQLEHDGELDRAVDEYRWALRWYTPWGPWHEDAANALWEIGQRQAPDRPMKAVYALDSLRSGLIASRSFYQPQSALLAKTNQAIPPLLVRAAERRADTRDPDVLLKRFEADYSRRVGVPVWASLAVAAGFSLWILALLMVFWRGVDARGHLQAAGWRWLGASLVGFASWTVAMWLA